MRCTHQHVRGLPGFARAFYGGDGHSCRSGPHGGSAIAGKWEQIVVWTAAGLSPDNVSGVSTEFGQYAINGMLTPLDPYIERDGVDMNQVLPAFADALKYDGKQYIMPYGSSGMVWMYNRDRFEMAGLPQPPANAGPDWTLDDLREAARRLTTWDGDRITAASLVGLRRRNGRPFLMPSAAAGFRMTC